MESFQMRRRLAFVTFTGLKIQLLQRINKRMDMKRTTIVNTTMLISSNKIQLHLLLKSRQRIHYRMHSPIISIEQTSKPHKIEQKVNPYPPIVRIICFILTAVKTTDTNMILMITKILMSIKSSNRWFNHYISLQHHSIQWICPLSMI